MKIKLQLMVALLFLSGDTLQLNAQGYIVPNGVTYGGYDQSFGYRIDVLHDPTGSVPLYSTNTQFWLNPAGKMQPTVYTNAFEFSELTDIQVDVFLVSSNDPISLQPILSGNYPWLSPYSSANQIFQSGVPFYVGLYSGALLAGSPNSTDPNLYNDPVFGWALLVNNQGVIEMLDAALEYGGAGITAGTQTVIEPVPEPSVLSLFGLGGAVLAWWRPKLM